MHFKKLDLNLLVALDSLLKKQSVTATAAELSLSPSTVSSSLSRLRDYFDDDLLTKVGRKMELTPLAESLKDPVRDILNRIESTILLRPVFEPHKTDRTFSFFISDYSQFVLIPHLLALAESQGSSANFNLLRQVSTPHESLQRGETDLLIIPEQFVSPHNPYEVLFEEDFVCLVWQQSPLANRDLTKEVYANAKHAVISLADGRVDHIEMELRERYNLERQVYLRTFSLGALPILLQNTNCIATVHARIARLVLRHLPLTLKKLPFQISPMQQCLQWHHYRSNDPGICWLRDLLKHAVNRMDD